MLLTDFFDEHGIEYWTSGKNVRRGYINIQCPFCDDDSNHCGINKKLKVYCWRCGGNSITNLIKHIAEVDYKEAKTICSDLSLGVLDTNPPAENYSSSEFLSASVQLPQESKKKFPKIHRDYLITRGFTPNRIDKIIRKYRLRACHTYPQRYKFRIIIPVIQNRKILSFTSRSIDDQAELKYREASNKPYKMNGKLIQECIKIPKQLVYNIDSVHEGGDAILVEGPIDVWKMGNKSICLFGVNYTEDQLIILKRKKIKNLFIMFDADKTGIRKTKAVARILAPLAKKTEILTLQNVNDPGDLNEEEVVIIKEQLGIK